jgi:hypothetical protein
MPCKSIRPLAKIRKYPETICVNRCLSARYLRLLYDSQIFARGLLVEIGEGKVRGAHPAFMRKSLAFLPIFLSYLRTASSKRE